MRKLLAQRSVLRQNWLAILGFSMLCYFSYHALLGERSYVRLMGLERQTARQETAYEALKAERLALEDRVTRLRPGTLDGDLLEERARTVLGFYRTDERVILN